MRATAVIPANNEAATIAEIAAGARPQVERVIVVDDGSTDGTPERLRGASVTLLRNGTKQGKAASLWRGMMVAIDGQAEAVITLDADGQHRPEDIPHLITAAQLHPNRIVIAARLRGRAQAPSPRRFANRFADFWISWAAGYPITDSQSGFRLYPSSLLRQLRIPHDRTRGFVWESEVLIAAARLGFLSVPVVIESIYGPSLRTSHYRSVVDTLRIVRMVAWKLIKRGFCPIDLLRALRLLPPADVQSARAKGG